MVRLLKASVFKSRRVRIDLGIAALCLVAFLFLLSGTEPFEAIYEFTRAHEDWDLDEIFSFMLAFTPIAIWFAARRMRDIVRLNQRISKLAFFDPLTLLPNRSLTLDHLMQMLKVEEARGKKLAVLFVDFDNFKMINDTYGHEAGDELLVGVSDRLNRGVRSGDIVGRIGGDEFVILLANIGSNDQVEVMADRLFKQMRKPIQLKGHELSVTMSIGVAIYPDDGESTTELLRASDTAMYAAKAEGKNNLHYYSKNMNDRMQKRMQIESRLRKALDKDEFNVLYQPLVHGESTKIKMVEALLRWKSADTHYSPLDFIPIAEETGLIIDIGLWVIRESARQIREWDEKGFDRIDVAVNVSAVQLRHPHFVENVIEILNEVGISPSRIEIEITESTLATDVDKMAAIIAQLRANGIRLAIDDFGTGYSSLSRLKDFDVDKLKIDRSFVQSLNGERQNELIVQSIISLAKAMEMLSVAEGVETPDQLAFLQSQGCDELQGFYFSRPVPPEDIESFMRAGSALKSS